MTTTEQIQELQNTVNNLSTQINSISAKLSASSNDLNLHLIDAETDINTINGKIAVLGNEDKALHQEIHNVSTNVDNNAGKINTLEVDAVTQDARLDNLEQADKDIKEQIDDMDVEHHNELHSLALAIDNGVSRINTLEIFKEGVPTQVVMSESEYNALGTPDYETYYFVYEEEN